MRKNILMLALIGSCISVTASVTNRWTNQEENTTPDTAINFSDAGNWSDGVIQDGSDVFFRFENFEPNQKRYVKLTTPIYLSHLYSRNKNIFIGEKFIFKGEDKKLRPGISLANSSNPPYLYNDIELTTFAPNMGPWFGAAYFACNIHLKNKTVRFFRTVFILPREAALRNDNGAVNQIPNHPQNASLLHDPLRFLPGNH